MKIYDSLENLLQKKYLIEEHDLDISYINDGKRDEPIKADSFATLDKIMTLLSKLVTKAMKKMKVEFSPDEGDRRSHDVIMKMEHPYIFYEVISREPKSELKPRQRESIIEVIDDNENKRQGRIWGQKFTCILQFNILACDYNEASEVMNNFEDLIFNYTSFLKRNGVAEIIFKKHFTDKNLDPYRQSLSVRSLQYYVEIEKLYVEFLNDIQVVDIQHKINLDR